MASTSPVSTSPAAGVTPHPASLPAPWPERELLPESEILAVSAQVYDPAARTLYALRPTAPGSAQAVLEAIDVRTGAIRPGGRYLAGDLALAAGYLWTSQDAGGHLVADQVAPGTLATVRAVPLVPGPGSAGTRPQVAAGPAGSAWIGAGRSLLRVSAGSGMVLARATLPAGVVLWGLAAGPDGDYLYASGARVVGGGGYEGAVLLEYSAGTGELLASAGGAPLSYSIVGAALTAMPGGVWASFRTGSLGQSVLLRAPGLSVVATAGGGTPGSTPYYWAMSSGSAYSGGVLWEEAFGGLVACISAATGKVLAEEVVSSPAAQLSDLLSADAAGRQLTGVVMSGPSAALVAITPPAAC